jgi:hypothetical protein
VLVGLELGDGATMLATGWGYKEFAVKMPPRGDGGIGPWPQFSLVAAGFDDRYTEIDVAFQDPADPKTIHMQLVYGCTTPPTDGCNSNNTVSICTPNSPQDDPNWEQWHTFGVDWEADSITGYVDGIALGSVTTGGSGNVYIPQGAMFPSMALAVTDSYTVKGPIYMNVGHYFDYVSIGDGGAPTMPPPPYRFGDVHTTAGSYMAGTRATIDYTIRTGGTPIGGADAAIGGVTVYIQNNVQDYLTDSVPSNEQGSTTNGYFGYGGGGGYNQVLLPIIEANSSYTGSVVFPIDAGIPSGVYTASIGLASIGLGVTCPLVIGSGQLPSAPVSP